MHSLCSQKQTKHWVKIWRKIFRQSVSSRCVASPQNGNAQAQPRGLVRDTTAELYSHGANCATVRDHQNYLVVWPRGNKTFSECFTFRVFGNSQKVFLWDKSASRQGKTTTKARTTIDWCSKVFLMISKNTLLIEKKQILTCRNFLGQDPPSPGHTHTHTHTRARAREQERFTDHFVFHSCGRLRNLRSRTLERLLVWWIGQQRPRSCSWWQVKRMATFVGFHFHPGLFVGCLPVKICQDGACQNETTNYKNTFNFTQVRARVNTWNWKQTSARFWVRKWWLRTWSCSWVKQPTRLTTCSARWAASGSEKTWRSTALTLGSPWCPRSTGSASVSICTPQCATSGRARQEREMDLCCSSTYSRTSIQVCSVASGNIFETTRTEKKSPFILLLAVWIQASVFVSLHVWTGLLDQNLMGVSAGLFLFNVDSSDKVFWSIEPSVKALTLHILSSQILLNQRDIMDCFRAIPGKPSAGRVATHPPEDRLPVHGHTDRTQPRTQLLCRASHRQGENSDLEPAPVSDWLSADCPRPSFATFCARTNRSRGSGQPVVTSGFVQPEFHPQKRCSIDFTRTCKHFDSLLF